MAWHMGNPLSQTLFTSFYLDHLLWPEPKSLEEAKFDRDKPNSSEKGLVDLVLRAYCLALLKSCNFVHQTISKEHYYEVGFPAQSIYFYGGIPLEEMTY